MAKAKASPPPAPVSLRNIHKSYGSFKAVDGVNLDITGGEFMTLLGPSGSGKTTTLKIIAGFIEQTAGELFIDNQIVTAPPHKRDIGMVFQNYALFPHMTALENVAFPLKMRGVPKLIRNKKAQETLEMVHLGDRINQSPKQLSGGQQQRVALARALVFEPRVVLMDEPLGALDKKLREFLQLEIRRIQQRLGITMVYVTHDQEEALVMSDRIAIFNEGRIVQIGTGEEIYESPNTRFVANFIGESNILNGELINEAEGNYFNTDIGKFQLPSQDVSNFGSESLSIVIRPEKLHIHTEDAEVSQKNQVRATVDDIIYLGSQRKYELKATDGTIFVAVSHENPNNYTPNKYDNVIVGWDVDSTRIVASNINT